MTEQVEEYVQDNRFARNEVTSDYSHMVAERRLLYAGYAALVLLPNGDLLNYFAQGTPLVIWKQLLAVLMAIFAVPVYQRMRVKDFGGAVHVEGLISKLLPVLLLLAAASLVQGISLYRLTYALIAYVGFASALLVVYAAIAIDRVHVLFRLLVVLGVVCGLGLVYDYFFATLDFLPRTGDIGLDDSLKFGYLRRASFLFGAPTTIYPFLSLAFIAAVIVLAHEQKLFYRILAVAAVIMIPTGLMFTGSRAQVGLIAVLLIVSVAGMAWYLRKPVLLATVSLVLLLGTYFFVSKAGEIAQWEQLIDRYYALVDATAEGNDTRYDTWKAGLDLVLSGPDLESFVGSGLGRTLGMVNDGQESTHHYESSFFQAFSEGGLLGVLLRYLPAAMAIRLLLRKVISGSFVAYLLLLWIAIYCVSVSVSPTAAAYPTQVAYFIVIALAFELVRIELALKGV